MRKFFFLALFPFLCSHFLIAADHLNHYRYETIIDRSGLTIATPSLAKREIRKLRLENGLAILLISDPDTPESGAALAVNVGSWDDPKERPGMAHFVEHLLFLGTKKYPEEEGYTRFLDEHGGNRNAFTMADRTVYMFSVKNHGFWGALDRFAQFFISPLFNPSGVERESKAIHQEYCQNLPQDAWRALYVKKELSNNKHPFHNFCIGNKDTLAKIKQEELKKWYEEHYSANLMHLVVYSKESLDLLEKQVVDLFSAVKNRGCHCSQIKEPLFNSQLQPRLCAIVPKQNLQFLELTWEIPRSYGQDRLFHADKLLSHVLGHEGYTSLLAQLKREKLAEKLSMGNFRAGHDQCLLSLTIQLTSLGVQEYQKVIERCFEAIAAVRNSGIPRYIFDEICHTEESGYRFQTRQEIFDLVSDYASHLIDEPLETFPRQTLLPTEYNSETIHDLIHYLTPQSCLYTLIADPSLTHIAANLKERWMGVEYAVVTLSKEKIEKWIEVAGHPKISIPRQNPFLPENFTIKGELTSRNQKVPQPVLICDEALGKIYAASDDRFLVPQISWLFSIKTPLIDESNPLTHLLADLYCHAIHEKLNPISYEALAAGLYFTLKTQHDALEFQINGYNDKAIEFLKSVAEAMKTVCPTEAEFQLYKELAYRNYSNAITANPLKQGKDLLWSILFKNYASIEKKKELLKQVNYEQMISFCDSILNTCYVKGMLYGNIQQEEAHEAWKIFKSTLAAHPYPCQLHSKIKLASLPNHEQPSYLVAPCTSQANALILTADCGPFSFKKRAAQEILTKGLEEPFFSELRTRQQTAYLVTNWSQEIEKHLYNFFAIQSASHDTRDLLARFELFLESSLQNLSDQVIPQERFEAIKFSCIEQLKYPADDIPKMGSLLHALAFQYDADFEWLEKRIEALQELSYDEFLEHAEAFLGKSNNRRLAICINGELPTQGTLSYRQLHTSDALRKEICYEN